VSSKHIAQPVSLGLERVDLGAARVRARSSPGRRTSPPVFGEELFRNAIVRERKRADRSEHPLVVLLVTVADARESSAWFIWPTVVQAVAVVSRKTDVLGWFVRRAVLGLILPDIAQADAAVPSQMVHRIWRELARRLDEDSLAKVSVRLYAYSQGREVDDCRTPGCSSKGSWCERCHGAPWARGGPFAPVDSLLETPPGTLRMKLRHGIKRGLDIVGSVWLLVALAPLFAVVAGLVKCTSPGPVFFRQVRVGRRGEPFTMLKFRTMHADAGHALHQDYVAWFIESSGKQPRSGHEVFKLTNDPRVTRVGHFLRKTSLDELPQFWNVLRGEMSLVGPRPPLPFEVERYQPWHRRRVLEVKPGITGLWQVSGRSRTTFDDMVRLDLRYARTWSLWTDIKILAATPWAVISGKGAC